MPTVTAYFDDRTLAQLEVLAQRTGKTKKEIVQEAIETQWAKARRTRHATERCSINDTEGGQREDHIIWIQEHNPDGRHDPRVPG